MPKKCLTEGCLKDAEWKGYCIEHKSSSSVSETGAVTSYQFFMDDIESGTLPVEDLYLDEDNIKTPGTVIVEE